MSEQRAVYITDESSELTPEQWDYVRNRPSRHQRTVVSVVPMPVTPHVELLSCGHAGLLHPPDVKHPEQHIGDTRECLTCKHSPSEERSHE